jgi:hypothetical protein
MTTMTAPTPAELAHLVLMATHAPSVHNTQPWRFVTEEDGLVLQLDRDRQLSVLDPHRRDLMVSCGAAVHHLQVAARALGLDTDVALLPRGDADETVARLHFTRGNAATAGDLASAVAILKRHTHRGRFVDEHVPDALLDGLRAAAEDQGAMIRVIKGDELVEVEVLVARAEQVLLEDPNYTAELAEWAWHGPQPAERGDGLPPAAIDHGPGRAESLQGRQFGGAMLPRPEDPPAPEHPTAVLLSTTTDSRLDWVRAGTALSAVLLAATEYGLVAQPIGQVIDVYGTRWALQHQLGIIGAPQMLLRLGFGSSVPTTPRRPVSEVYSP